MNKKLLIIVAIILISCYVDDLDVNKHTFVIPENTCDCVYYSDYDWEWKVMKLRPGIISFGWLSYNRLDYCEQVMKGYLTNCK